MDVEGHGLIAGRFAFGNRDGTEIIAALGHDVPIVRQMQGHESQVIGNGDHAVPGIGFAVGDIELHRSEVILDGKAGKICRVGIEGLFADLAAVFGIVSVDRDRRLAVKDRVEADGQEHRRKEDDPGFRNVVGVPIQKLRQRILEQKEQKCERQKDLGKFQANDLIDQPGKEQNSADDPPGSKPGSKLDADDWVELLIKVSDSSQFIDNVYILL